jgi:AraC family transcriptional regulator
MARRWSVEHAKLASWQIRRACEFIEARLEGDPSIAEIARECRLSASHFARAFRQTVGMPPHRWLMQRRIQRAKELLATGELPLANIALACGFVDQSHLSRIFTQQVGSTPGRWRRFRDPSAAS